MKDRQGRRFPISGVDIHFDPALGFRLFVPFRVESCWFLFVYKNLLKSSNMELRAKREKNKKKKNVVEIQ